MLGWITALLFGTGAMLILYFAYAMAASYDAQTQVHFVVAVAVFLFLLFTFARWLNEVEASLRGFEIFFNFEDRRSEVRHSLFCRHHFDCLALHYFYTPQQDTEHT